MAQINIPRLPQAYTPETLREEDEAFAWFLN